MIINFLESLNQKTIPNNDYHILFGEGDTPTKIERFTSTFNVFTCFPDYEPNGRKFLEKIKSTHQLIYNRSLVTNFLHIITKGGVLLYPADLENPNGYVEFVFEAVPMAFIMNNCGGITKDSKKNILDIPFPITKKKIKQKTNFITGGTTELSVFNDVINPSLVFFD